MAWRRTRCLKGRWRQRWYCGGCSVGCVGRECRANVETPHSCTRWLAKTTEDEVPVAIEDMHFGFGEDDSTVGVADTADAEEVVCEFVHEDTVSGT